MLTVIPVGSDELTLIQTLLALAAAPLFVESQNDMGWKEP